MKKKYGIQIVVWTSLAVLFLTALLSVTGGNVRYIGKSYVESNDFQWEMNNFYGNLTKAVLNPIDIEAEKKRITVTKSEIEEHRNYYGTLSEQIGNIETQYTQRITDAEAGKSEKLKETLIEERDAKIDDIRMNFESDAHVEAKIRGSKEKQLEEELQRRIQNTEENLHFPVVYELTDSQTGEKFTSGDIHVTTGYKETFSAEEGYFLAAPDRMDDFYYDSYSSEAYESGVSAFRDTVSTVTEETVSEHAQDNALESSQPQMVKKFEGTVVVPQSALQKGSLGINVDQYNQKQLSLYFLWMLGVLALAALLTVIRFNKVWVTTSYFVERYQRQKIDLKAALLLLSAGIVWVLVGNVVGRYVVFFTHYRLESGVLLGMTFVILMVFLWMIVFQLVLLVGRVKVRGALEQDIKESYSMRFLLAWKGMFLNRSIGVQMFLLLIGFFFAGIGLFGVLIQPILIMIYIPLVLFVGLPFLYIFVRRTAYLNRIMVATEAMANGRLFKEIAIEGKSPLAEHAKNLNNLREGVHNSMTEQAKSERLKTELITNVSHDLRTPLTSIITYTDLLKNEDLSKEERMKYVGILDKKSERLKTLIEDLFEVSKMASGNLELNKQRVDMTQLLQQALAEHEEEISKSGLDFRVNFPDSELVAYVDGKRWWRVLDNLIVNAIKYTLPGTRVYITLRKVGDSAEFVVKNVTKYELGENTDELYERFKRADTSRHTDGSGLGLAIAQSIVDLHNGNMKIEVDGDLFKVTVVVAAV
ncbi:K+-sensing histidine kinase KdpD [Sporosarcina sp. ANT_H38]|uniref:sensor histidine kinase n=1 Tax=Sporosarcina sp. ANT_H38 TaxID=2597358 RepID=UPI00165EA728|nr:HAMP domain-containing sensor histidine kinase [Sporosarcina sp. ANT_H38]